MEHLSDIRRAALLAATPLGDAILREEAAFAFDNDQPRDGHGRWSKVAGTIRKMPTADGEQATGIDGDTGRQIAVPFTVVSKHEDEDVSARSYYKGVENQRRVTLTPDMLKSLHTSQRAVSEDKLLAMAKTGPSIFNPDDPERKPPNILEHAGKMYLQDGHHRLALAAAAKEPVVVDVATVRVGKAKRR